MRSPWQARGTLAPAAPFQVPSLIWQALMNRGLDPSEVESFLKPSLQSLRSPFSLKGMAEAVERLVAAFKTQEPLCIYADFDLDGTSALALLKTGLERLGFKNVTGYQPRRLAEGYGVHVPAVQEIAKEGIRLLITVDVGITAHEALREAKKLGVDVILTDHHLPVAGEIPPALAVINPNQGSCPSGLGHLAGVGVALYLLLGVRARLRALRLGNFAFDVKELLDFFVIGTLTDMVPLIAENRPLVRHGLRQLEVTQRPGLRALLDRLELSGRPLSSADVAIKFSPKLNALSRLESSLRPIDMMLASSREEAETMATLVLECNQRRVDLQKAAEQQALVQVESDNEMSCAMAWSPDFHRGVVGLVATKLAQRFHCPVFVGAVDESGRIVGSARLPPKSSASLVLALESAKEYLERFGGHAQAAGFETSLAQIEDLKMTLQNYFKHQLNVAQPLFYDAEGDLRELSTEVMRWQEGLEPFGSEFETPVYRLKGAFIKKVTELRGGHLRLELTDRTQTVNTTAIWFSPGAEALTRVQSVALSGFELLAELQWNYFQGRKTLQLLLKDLQPDLLNAAHP